MYLNIPFPLRGGLSPSRGIREALEQLDLVLPGDVEHRWIRPLNLDLFDLPIVVHAFNDVP